MGSVIPFTGDQNGPISKVKPKSISKKEKVAKPRESYACPWAMQVSKLPNEDTWEVRTLKDTHTCLQSRIVSKCTATFLSKDVEETIKPNDKITLNTLKDQLQKKFEVGVSKQKVFRAKKWLMKELWEAIASSMHRTILAKFYCCWSRPNNWDHESCYAVVESEARIHGSGSLDCLGDDLGCKSKKGGGSQQAGVAGHGDAAHGSQQPGVHGSQTTKEYTQLR
ncbi:hypothetical protein Tco_0276728 [Tanacetum coccineum]